MIITFEGLDGSGKTTQVALLADYLRKKGQDVLSLREPGATALGEKIRQVILDNQMSPTAEFFLFLAARAQLVHEIILPNRHNKILILDRYMDSTLAYQGYGRGLNLHVINQAQIPFPKPDLTFFLDISIETMQNRLAGQKLNRLDQEHVEFYRRVVKGYGAIHAARIVRLDGSLPVETVHAEIVGRVNRTLKIE